MKKVSPWCLAVVATLAPLGVLGGLLGAIAAHGAILLVTVGIFFATLSLGRSAPTLPKASRTPLPHVHIDIRG